MSTTRELILSQRHRHQMLDSMLRVRHIPEQQSASLLLTDATGERSLRCSAADRPVVSEVTVPTVASLAGQLKVRHIAFTGLDLLMSLK